MSWLAVTGVAVAALGAAGVPPTEPPATPPATSVPSSSVPSSSVPPPTSVPAVDPTDPLGCNAVVFDPAGELDAGVVAEAASRIAGRLGADLHVRAEGNLDRGLAARMGQLEAQCPSWVDAGGGRGADLVVVMYSSTEREAAVFYGAGQADALEARWEFAVDTMGPRFAAGDFTGGVLAGLDELQRDPPVQYSPPPYDATAYDDRVDEEPSGPGVPPIIWLGLIALVVIAIVRVAKYFETGEWATDGNDGEDSGSSWSSSSSRRSRSSSWSSRRSSSRSSSRSSPSRSRSSGRAGGGSKKW